MWKEQKSKLREELQRDRKRGRREWGGGEKRKIEKEKTGKKTTYINTQRHKIFSYLSIYLCVWVSVCLYVCVPKEALLYISVYFHTHIHTHTHTHIYIYIIKKKNRLINSGNKYFKHLQTELMSQFFRLHYTYIHTYMCVYVCVHTYVNVYVCIRV